MKINLEKTCANCGVTECLNLYFHDEDDKVLTGGEFFIYNFLNHSKIEELEIDWYVCSNGRFLQSSCFIIGCLNTLEETYADPLVIASNELVRDLKASIYLAFSGHYRQAIQILRCVFETFLYGLYFQIETTHFSKTEDEFKQCEKQFKSWFKGGFRKSDVYLREIIRRGKIIDKQEEKEWGKLFEDLSKYIHTLSATPTERLVIHCDECDYDNCYAQVKFDKKQLKQWSNYFQKIVGLILYKLIKLYPIVKKEEPGKLTISMIRAEVKESKYSVNFYLEKLSKMKIPAK